MVFNLNWFLPCFSFFLFYKIVKRFSGWQETLLRELPVISSFLISWAAFSSIQNWRLSFKAPSQDCCQMRSVNREVLLWGPNVVSECIRNCKWHKMTRKIYIFRTRTQEIPSPGVWLTLTNGIFKMLQMIILVWFQGNRRQMNLSLWHVYLSVLSRCACVEGTGWDGEFSFSAQPGK